ncbi:MAG: hypothetical protein KJZ87_12280 [Thermoguttaceae bacterium]|nr:hypothetical protein [Thermoguttaceae bacterium]
MALLNCPRCGEAVLLSDEEAAGAVVRCSRCQSVFSPGEGQRRPAAGGEAAAMRPGASQGSLPAGPPTLAEEVRSVLIEADVLGSRADALRERLTQSHVDADALGTDAEALGSEAERLTAQAAGLDAQIDSLSRLLRSRFRALEVVAAALTEVAAWLESPAAASEAEAGSGGGAGAAVATEQDAYSPATTLPENREDGRDAVEESAAAAGAEAVSEMELKPPAGEATTEGDIVPAAEQIEDENDLLEVTDEPVRMEYPTEGESEEQSVAAEGEEKAATAAEKQPEQLSSAAEQRAKFGEKAAVLRSLAAALVPPAASEAVGESNEYGVAAEPDEGFDADAFRFGRRSEGEAPAAGAIRTRPSTRKREKSVVGELLGVVLGGATGLLIAYYGLNYFGGARFDFAEIYLPGVPHTYEHKPDWWPGGSPSADEAVPDSDAGASAMPRSSRFASR